MILGSDKADGSLRETFKSTAYPVEIDGQTYNLYDTAGLGEHNSGNVDSVEAGNLYRLVTKLSDDEGLHLLIFVVKCGRRLTESIHKNYSLFHHGFCDSKVPIVIVVTGCETVKPPMDTWWIDNKAWFTKTKMSFDGHACVCAFKGSRTRNGGYPNEDLVEESREAVRRLLVRCCKKNGWKRVCHL